jgi:hypothetical protein
VIFRNDVLRTDKQLGIFGEASFDLPTSSPLTLGARYYDVEVDLEGSANSSFYNLYTETATNRQFGTNISAQSTARMASAGHRTRQQPMASSTRLRVNGPRPQTCCSTPLF